MFRKLVYFSMSFARKAPTNVTFLEYNSTQVPSAPALWPEMVAAMFLIRFILPVVIFFGTVGNAISVMVLMRKSMRNTSVNFYLSLLACADTSVLYLSGFKTWLRVITGYELLHVSAAACKTTTFLLLLTLHLSAWLIVLISFDRFIVIWFPLRASTFCSYRRSQLMSLGLVALSVVCHAHVFWTLHLQTFSNGKKCAPLSTNDFMNRGYNYLKMATYSIIPCFAVLVTNVGTIVRMYQHSKVTKARLGRINQVANGGRCGGTVQNNKKQVTIMLLFVTFTWLCFTAPFVLFDLIPKSSRMDAHSKARVFLGKAMCFIFMYLNHSINFLLYCIAGKRFRSELALLANDVIHVCRKRQSTGTSISMVSVRRSKSNRSCQTPMI